MAEKAPNTQVHIEPQGGEPTHDIKKQISSGSDSGNHAASLECTDSKGSQFPEDSQCHSVWSIEEEEHYAREGIITFLSDPSVAIEHFRAGMERGQSPLIHYGYASVFFIRAVVSFSETPQLDDAYKLLEAARTHCHKARNSLPKGSARRIYHATLEHDCELFQAFLQFMKESMAGYIKGGLGIRSVWKSYAKTFKKAEKLFSSQPPIRPPFSDSAESAELGSEPLEQLRCLHTESSGPAPSEGADLEEVDLRTPEGGPSEEARVRRAVYMGYGIFHLLLSLIPKKFLKIANLLGFQGDRRFGLECLHFGLSGKDMREPIAAINLLWFLTLLIPQISRSEITDPSGQEARAVLCHLTAVSPDSSLSRYFSARIAMMAKDLDVAMAELKLAGQDSFFPKEMHQVTCHDRALIAMLQNNFELALAEIQSIINYGTRYMAVVLHMAGLLTGYLSDAREALKLFESAIKAGHTSANSDVEKFTLKRCAFYCKRGVTYVGMHMALLEQLYMMNYFRCGSPAVLAANLESVQRSVASATDPFSRCMGLLAQGNILKCLGCPNEAEECFEAILACGAKQLKNDKHILVMANIEMSVLARTHRRDAARSTSFLHTARDKFGDYYFDVMIQMVISHELSLSKALRKLSKAEN